MSVLLPEIKPQRANTPLGLIRPHERSVMPYKCLCFPPALESCASQGFHPLDKHLRGTGIKRTNSFQPMVSEALACSQLALMLFFLYLDLFEVLERWLSG